MARAYLLAGVRTPIGRFRGALARTRPDDLAALAVRTAVERAGVLPVEVDEVILGATNQAGEDSRNVARMAALLAGLPEQVAGLTVNRLCASGLSAIIAARHAIVADEADVVVAGGVESMTRAPWVTAKPERSFVGPGPFYDSTIGWRFTNPAFDAETTLSMPETAEIVADRWRISREEQDEFALRSHLNAVAAHTGGLFDAEIVEVSTVDGVVRTDEGPRADTSAERLSELSPIVRPDGSVTAGNSSSLNDGAAAVVVVSERYLHDHGHDARFQLMSAASVGVSPEVMGIGPVPASLRALERAGWSVADLESVELNEAFASQSIACVRELGLDPGIVNARGGAIALGHPLGASGARIVVTLMERMRAGGQARGLATMCVGVGQGTALLLEQVN